MAYFSDGYIWPQENTTYDHTSYQDSSTFSRYDPYDLDTYNAYTLPCFDQPKFINYNHQSNSDYDYNYNYGYGYDYGNGNNGMNYFAHNYVETKLIAYQPGQCDTGYVSYHTHYSVSNPEMQTGFNEPEFEEYDPTPYGGGYDIVSTYGKPLPPSDKTCYPRSGPKPIEPKSRPNSENQPETKSKPDPEPMPVPTTIPIAEPKSKPEPEPVPVITPMPVSTLVPSVDPEPDPEPESGQALVPMPDPFGETVMEENGYSKDECDYRWPEYDYPWPEYDYVRGNGVGYDCQYGYGDQVGQVPANVYDPEVVEFCESIFGSWPCLAKIRRQQMGINNNKGICSCSETRNQNPWEDCANYFFGSPIISYNQ
ncbi:uncharacterized protein [Rutidosis leptorrhynchoides]|uniref:uncharacterized protein n=1 Tax=Rutidosis leptorrhynchoides TaxID=125765 RepID=UPI003A996302